MNVQLKSIIRTLKKRKGVGVMFSKEDCEAFRNSLEVLDGLLPGDLQAVS